MITVFMNIITGPIPLEHCPDVSKGGTSTYAKGLAKEGHAEADEGSNHDVGS